MRKRSPASSPLSRSTGAPLMPVPPMSTPITTFSVIEPNGTVPNVAKPEVVVEGLAFGEGPRWRDGRLWFSDMHDHAVKAFSPATGQLDTVVEVRGSPSGLGWDAAGRLLIVSMDDRRLLRLEVDGLREVADLSGYTDK